MLISMAKKGRRWTDATVTRRDGWAWLVDRVAAGKWPLLEVIEWSPRVGARWVCLGCNALGPLPARHDRGRKRLQRAQAWKALHKDCAVVVRKPRRLGRIRIIDARRELLSAIYLEPAGCAREGFPELSPEEFVRLYMGRRDARLADHWPVTRIFYQVAEVYDCPVPQNTRATVCAV